MKKFIRIFFSMKFAGPAMLLFAAILGIATFIENDLGTNAAKDMIYNAKWFEILLFIIAISLLGSIFQYRLLQHRKYCVLLFHLAFLFILAGAFITRHYGFEGIMQIREGETSRHILTSSPFVQVWIEKDGETRFFNEGVTFSPYKKNHFNMTIPVEKENLNISFKKYIANAAETIVEDPDGYPIVSFVTIEGRERKNAFLRSGETFTSDELTVIFSNTVDDPAAVQIRLEGDTFEFRAPFEVNVTEMMARQTDTLDAGIFHPLNLLWLYSFKGKNFFFNNTFKTALTKITAVQGVKGSGASPAVVFDIKYQDKLKEIAVFGGTGLIAEPVSVEFHDMKFKIAYGAKETEIPFAIKLLDFRLDRYPGSMSPSSFASEVLVIDEAENREIPYRIYMNNILNYKGFRFFQSSYDPDEKGTVLSVNHDKWGTIVTYTGYFLLTLGLLLNFFSKRSRFRMLVRNASRIKAAYKNSTALILLAFMFVFHGLNGRAQEAATIENARAISREHAAKFGALLVQDNDGRIKPINTLTSEVLRKVYRKDALSGLNSDQVFLGMLVHTAQWQAYPMIKVSDMELKSLIGINGNYASFYDFILNDGSYKLSDLVDKAYNKRPVERNSFNKDIISVDERVNIIYMVFTGDFLNIFPKAGHVNNKWFSGQNSRLVFDSTDAGFVGNILPLYYEAVRSGIKSGDWSTADEYLRYLKTFQQRYGSDVMPPPGKIIMEIIYNKVNIFKRIFPVYSFLGLSMLILAFIRLLSQKRGLDKIINILGWFIALVFVLHTAGLTARWYIAGRAPWSNGYETMIYISWGIVLAGLIFSRNSKITLATTAMLASITLMVANLSWLNPEITNLVPVLKSYWLVIHVAVITASYSFLAIGALLGFLNLLLINFMNRANLKRLKLVLEELTNIVEMNLLIGVFLITTGTFLGAVWANESWGRYWGWDPKETWALITVLVYSFVVHMRLIPGLNGTYAFNFASLLSFGSVLMTYFGVNYFLSGMHSYAQGDPVAIPSFVYWALFIIAVVSIMGYVNYVKMKGSIQSEKRQSDLNDRM